MFSWCSLCCGWQLVFVNALSFSQKKQKNPCPGSSSVKVWCIFNFNNIKTEREREREREGGDPNWYKHRPRYLFSKKENSGLVPSTLLREWNIPQWLDQKMWSWEQMHFTLLHSGYDELPPQHTRSNNLIILNIYSSNIWIYFYQ